MTYYASRKCVVERVPEREADLEPFDVREVARHAAQERGRHAHAGEVERAHGDAPDGDAREVLLRRELAPADAHEAERLHGPSREDGRGGGGAPAEGAQVRHVRWREAQRAVVVAQAEVQERRVAAEDALELDWGWRAEAGERERAQGGEADWGQEVVMVLVLVLSLLLGLWRAVPRRLLGVGRGRGWVL